MKTRASSIKGRGEELLTGVRQAVQVAPAGSEPTTAESEVLEPASAASQPVADQAVPAAPQAETLSADEADLAKALYEEARDAEPAVAEKGAGLPSETGWPPTPEMELALFEDTLAAEQPSQLEAAAPSPTSEEKMTAGDVKQGAAAPETAQTLGSGVLPSKLSRAYTRAALATSPTDGFDLQSPGEPVEDLELPDEPLAEDQVEELTESAGTRFQKLDAEIDKLYDKVLSEVGENDSIATECFNQLLKARDIVLRRDVSRLSQAEY